MKLAALVLLGGTLAAAQELPAAPKPVFTKIDWALAGGVAVARGFDWASTEHGLTKNYYQWHEKELPGALVKSKAGFGAFSAVMAGAQILGQYELEKTGHRKLARRLQLVAIGSGAATDIHNYTEANGRRLIGGVVR